MIKISPDITNVINIDATPILTVSEVGNWLNLPLGLQLKNKDLIESLIKTTTEVIEKYTWLALRRTTYEAFFDLGYEAFYNFIGGQFAAGLERAPIVALEDITKIEYLNENGIYEEFTKGALTSEGLYENVTEAKEQRQWASVYFREPIVFDSSRINAYKIKITFISGFTIPTDPVTTPVTDIPSALKTAMLMIIASYYTNRGDCSDKGCSLNGYPIPCVAKSIIDQFGVSSTILGASYENMSNQPANCGWGL